MVTFNFYIVVEMKSFKQDTIDLTTQRMELENRIDKDDEDISLILRQKALCEEIFQTIHF